MKILGLLIGTVVLFLSFYIPIALLSGVIISDLWRWFVVPIGVAPIGVVQAVGISLLISALTFGLAKSNEVKKQQLLPRLIGMTLGLLMLWGLAAIFSCFM